MVHCTAIPWLFVVIDNKTKYRNVVVIYLLTEWNWVIKPMWISSTFTTESNINSFIAQFNFYRTKLNL